MTVASRRALIFLLVTIFIDTVGFGIIIPVLPGLLMQLVGGSLSQAALFGGLLMLIFSAPVSQCSHPGKFERLLGSPPGAAWLTLRVCH